MCFLSSIHFTLFFEVLELIHMLAKKKNKRIELDEKLSKLKSETTVNEMKKRGSPGHKPRIRMLSCTMPSHRFFLRGLLLITYPFLCSVCHWFVHDEMLSPFYSFFLLVGLTTERCGLWKLLDTLKVCIHLKPLRGGIY